MWVWDGLWDTTYLPTCLPGGCGHGVDTMTEGGGIYVRTRIPAKVFTDLERLANLQGMSMYEFVRELVTQGVKARLGTLTERTRMEKDHETALADLREREAEALEDLGSRAVELRMKKAPPLSPLQAIVSAFNTGDGEGALARFRELRPHVQENVLRRLQKEAPEIAERLQEGG